MCALKRVTPGIGIIASIVFAFAIRSLPTALAGDDEYKLVDPSARIECQIEEFYLEGKVSDEGLIPTGGGLERFICNNQQIALDSKKFENGFISTKEYGKIKVRFGSLYDNGFAIFMNDDQISRISLLSN